MHYTCANLVHMKDGKLLLVKVRENEHYYLPGGKIEAGEDDRTSLERELREELSLELDKENMQYLYTVTGPAYPDTDKSVELRCYKYDGDIGDIQMNSEITDVKYVDINDKEKIAPAVNKLIEEYL
ncbi:NUDIX domain-containing protein [Macrococcoides canis]|uniref:NUDIX domain-containing protein n=1 Tax=Macrococcoides canis TaxID=1855823 RepID=UPI001AEC519B|nr:NUDIX domain-containing protein [Macrococcus canis]MCO4097156.1 NUDIX domain-containing protein [Macrococcus canis]QTQ07817.1 NUDIX domain-containing protein [Macrococcus canis]UTH08913.1 NUDIX domain-containing protein [Macrococcus canis]